MHFLDELNSRQRSAAEALSGPLLIVAGAGSGKTRTLTYRIANLIAQGAAKPWQILAVTFTNKAAEEMKKRIQKLLKAEFDLGEETQPTIGTFHSICVRILRRHIEKLGRQGTFVIYDTDDTRALMKRILKELNIDDEKINPPMVLGMISKAKNQLESPEKFEARAGNYFERTIAQLYKAYEERLAKNNALDFDDLLVYTVNLFRRHSDVLDQYQEKWRFIHVDEYQDTNHVQYILTNLLAQKYRNLCVIGDSDQSIYRFRGADIRNILEFEKDYADAVIIKLEENYRSTQNILAAANAVIDKNENRVKKAMYTQQAAGDLIDVWHLDSEYEEAETVAREIRDLRGGGGRLGDCVVLYRMNHQSRLLEEALLRYGMPYKVIGGVRFYSRAEVKDLLAYLRVILNPDDTDSMLRIINVPPRKIGQTSLQHLQAFALSRSLTLAEVLKHIEMVDELGSAAKSALAAFYMMLTDWQALSHKVPVAELLKDIIQRTKFDNHLKDGTEEGDMRYENLLELVGVASKYNGLAPQDSLKSFLEEVALIQDTDNLGSADDAVTLMTLHAAKGLEFPYVFIVGCEENLFPHQRSMLDPEELAEERRLMYVGLTRAMKKLYLVASKARTVFGDRQFNRLSRFVGDIPKSLMREVGVGKDYQPYVQVSGEPARTEKPVAEEKFRDGDRVVHSAFGEGVVVERRGDLVTVAFVDKKIGIKKFAANIAPLEKL